MCGVQECDTWNSIAKVRSKAGQDRELVLEAFRKAAELAQTPQQKVWKQDLLTKCLQDATPLTIPLSLRSGWCAQSHIAVPSVPSLGCGGGGGDTLGGKTLPPPAGAP